MAMRLRTPRAESWTGRALDRTVLVLDNMARDLLLLSELLSRYLDSP